MDKYIYSLSLSPHTFPNDNAVNLLRLQLPGANLLFIRFYSVSSASCKFVQFDCKIIHNASDLHPIAFLCSCFCQCFNAKTALDRIDSLQQLSAALFKVILADNTPRRSR